MDYPDVELGMIVELPLNLDSAPFLTPVRNGKCALEILYGRMEKIVPLKDIVFLAGHDDGHIPYGNFVAEKGLFLFRTHEVFVSTRLMRAAASRRMKTIIRINACHTFADPELLTGMLEMHKQSNSGFTWMEGAPAWLGGEIFGSGELIDSHLIAETEGRISEQPGDVLRTRLNEYKFATYKPAGRRRWKNINLSLADRSSAALVYEAIRRAPDPMTVTLRDFQD